MSQKDFAHKSKDFPGDESKRMSPDIWFTNKISINVDESNDFPGDESKRMSPDIWFTNKISINVDESNDGDIKWASKTLKAE